MTNQEAIHIIKNVNANTNCDNCFYKYDVTTCEDYCRVETALEKGIKELENIHAKIQDKFTEDCHYDYYTADSIGRFIWNRISELKGGRLGMTNERECANCKNKTDQGCKVWDCKYESKENTEKIIVYTKDHFDPDIHMEAHHILDTAGNILKVFEDKRLTIYMLDRIQKIEIKQNEG